jgi:hypothetical protein
VQTVDAADGHGTIGGDVLPAIGQRAGEVGLADGVADERAGLEQVGAPTAAIGDVKAGAATGQGKTGRRARR